MIVLDARVVVAHYGLADAHHDRATAFLAANAATGFGISSVALAEVLVGPVGRGAMAEAVLKLQQGRHRRASAPPADAARRLAELRASAGLKLPDCCVLLAAQDAGSAAVATFDERLAAAARRFGLVTYPNE